MRARNSNSVVAANVRTLREKLGWSQEMLGEKAGLHRTYIGAIERSEENITLNTLDRIAVALHVAADELVRPGK